MRCTISFEDVVQDKKSPSRLLPITTETRRKGKTSKLAAVIVRKSGPNERRCWALKKMLKLLSERCVVKRLFFLEGICRKPGLVIEGLNSILEFETLHSLYRKASRLSAMRLFQYLLSKNVYSRPARPAEKQERVSLLKVPVIRACNEVLAHNQKQYALPGLHVHFAQREKPAILIGLPTRAGLGETQQGKKYYTVVGVFLFIAPFINKPLIFEGRYELSQIKLQYTGTVKKVLAD